MRDTEDDANAARFGTGVPLRGIFGGGGVPAYPARNARRSGVPKSAAEGVPASDAGDESFLMLSLSGVARLRGLRMLTGCDGEVMVEDEEPLSSYDLLVSTEYTAHRLIHSKRGSTRRRGILCTRTGKRSYDNILVTKIYMVLRRSSATKRLYASYNNPSQK